MRLHDVERLYAEHARGLLRFLAYRAGDERLAEDLVSEVFERAIRVPRLRARDSAAEKAWLYKTALNLLRDRFRRQDAEGRALDRATPPTGAGASSGFEERIEDRELLLGALAGLSDEEREALALRFGAELSVPEVVRITGQSLSTAEGRVYRGLRKLRDLLDE